MGLSRVKTWTDGEVLFAVDQNTEFNNILNNPISLISPTTGAINFNAQAHTGLIPAAVTGTSGSTGQMVGILPTGTVAFLNSGIALSRTKGLVGNLSSQSGTFSADGYQMQSSSALTWMVSATSAFTVSVGTAGPVAGGRDKAGSFSSTEVHWYAITTGLGSTAPAGIVSSQAPPQGPVLPANYIGWTYLGGSPYSSASTTIANAWFRGGRAILESRAQVLTNGTSTAEATVSLVTGAPSNAGIIELSGDLQTTAALEAVGRVRVTTGLDIHALVTGPTVNDRDTAVFPVPNVNRSIFYISNGSTAGKLQLFVLGYTMPNGDV